MSTASHWLDGSPMDPCATPADPHPAIPGFPMLHQGAGATIVGPTGGGRSSLIQACLYDAAREGVRCAYLGHEVTEPEFNARAARLAARRGDPTDDKLRASLAHVRYLNLFSVVAHANDDPGAWVSDVTARYDVVVIDPLSAVASALDLDFDNSNRDFVTFYDRIVQPLTTNGVTVAMIDNVGHASEAQKRAKGVSAKADRADLTFVCSRHPAGLVIHTDKVRSVRSAAQHGDEWVFERDTQRLERRTGANDGAGAWRPTTIMARISELVASEPGITADAIRKGVKGKNDAKDVGLRQLIAEGFIEVHPDGPARRHHAKRPFTSDGVSTGPRPDLAPTPETTSPPTRPLLAPTSPRNSPHDLAPRPHPLHRGGARPGEDAAPNHRNGTPTTDYDDNTDRPADPGDSEDALDTELNRLLNKFPHLNEAAS
jgi:hypothetical protein